MNKREGKARHHCSTPYKLHPPIDISNVPARLELLAVVGWTEYELLEYGAVDDDAEVWRGGETVEYARGGLEDVLGALQRDCVLRGGLFWGKVFYGHRGGFCSLFDETCFSFSHYHQLMLISRGSFISIQ
jgi:hypothetical protein